MENLEDTMAKDAAKEKKMGNEERMPPEMKQLRRKIENLSSKLKAYQCRKSMFNSPDHSFKWSQENDTRDSFTLKYLINTLLNLYAK